MSLYAILEKIRAAGDNQVGEIEAQARIQVFQILADARGKAEEARRAAFLEASAPVAKERASILHHARLESLKTVGEVREALVDTALERIRGYLAGLRTDQSYSQIFTCLVLEALDEIRASVGNAGSIFLDVDPRDQLLVEKIILNLHLDLEIGTGLSCWGGLVAKSGDGRVVVTNTLEARLERALPYLRRYLAAMFESEHYEQCPTTTMATRVFGR